MLTNDGVVVIVIIRDNDVLSLSLSLEIMTMPPQVNRDLTLWLINDKLEVWLSNN